MLARLGAGFDIVSGGELARVLAAGGDAKKTLFSGVGKSEVEIAYALENAIGCLNVESEAELAFAGLHQLLHPIIGLTEHLSEAQRRAIDAAFGVSGELEPDPFRVALAAFQLVGWMWLIVYIVMKARQQ